MLHNPSTKYHTFPSVPLPSRRWPGRTIQRAPIWMSTDLRDGNQALIEPMTLEMKLEFFEMLVAIGFKEIEVGFPSASQTDFDFVRRLIDERRIPEDVTIEVLSHAREDLLRRTFEALEGATRAIVHQVNAISPTFRHLVFAQSREQIKALAVNGARVVRQLADERPGTHWTFEYSPEMFSTAELAYSREICDAVADAWRPTPAHKMIINLPASVEAATPNIYADQIEWMDCNLSYRDSIVLSVHPHNDRGTAVAAAELALLAGADRVEGCLFGNGERTGNVDLVTLALNMYTQGIDPGLDFSNIDAVRRVAERCNQIAVHPRHPYAGELVFTAFSGSHQDAIRKGFAQQRPDAVWEVPYLPIDPADLGRDYAALIRVNSQSGKGGTTYLIERALGFTPPRALQIEFSQVVQAQADASGSEVTSAALVALFTREYLEARGPLARTAGTALRWRGHDIADIAVPLAPQDSATFADAESVARQIEASGGPAIQVTAYEQQKLADGRTACFVACRSGGGQPKYGVAAHTQSGVAMIEAMAGAVNRALNAQPQSDAQCAA